MGDLLIYVPGSCDRSRAGLKSLGLDGYDDDSLVLTATDAIDQAPDGGVGVLFYWTPKARGKYSIPTVDTEKQIWRPCVADGDKPHGRAWIGWSKDAQPTAADLQRETLRPGQWLTLADGGQWLIPIAQQLPRVLGLNDAGNDLVGVVADKYEPFWKAALSSLEMFTPTENDEFSGDFVSLFEFAALALSINYRMGRDLIGVGGLGLVTSEHLFDIPRIAADYEALAEIAGKKKLNATSDTSAGGAA